MQGEKINIFSRIYIHYEKRIKSAYFQLGISDLRAILRKYWYILII
jgi:hypothetical protein